MKLRFQTALFLVLFYAATPAQAQDASDQSVADQDHIDQDQPAMAEIEQAWERGDFTTARAGLERLAKKTATPLAQYRYGRILLEGRGGPRDVAGAAQWLQKAVDQNHAPAATLLARLLLSAKGETRDPVRAVSLLERAATRGEAEAQYFLALLLKAGDGTAQDLEAAFNWLFAAAEQQHLQATYSLSRAYARGEGTQKDLEEALYWMREAASNGHVQAQLALAQVLETGQVGPANPKEALEWYRRAAEAGLPVAQRVVGTRYLQGDGVAQNGAEALRWLESAAKAGDAGAMANLAYVYESGAGGQRDDALAAKWYERAAGMEVPQGIIGLARLHEEGRGVEQDLDRALALYRQAAEAGAEPAARRLGELAGQGLLDGKMAPQRMVPWASVAAESDPGARRWLEERASAGDAPAMAALANILMADPDRVPDGQKFLKSAAEGGVLAAQVQLGQLYTTGADGMPLDYVLAYKWLNIAATGGYTDAAKSREVIAAVMTPEQIADAQDATRAYYEESGPQAPATAQSVSQQNPSEPNTARQE